MQSAQIYLDYAATSPVAPEVVTSMLPYWTTHFGNPSSVHRLGQRALAGLEEARATIAAHFNVASGDVVFTSCGSESDNLALRGVMFAQQERGRDHLITCAIEHKAVLATALQLRDRFGLDVTVLPVDGSGRVRIEDVAAAIKPDRTGLISIMAASNEIGTVQPVAEIGALARAHGIPFHTDAVQTIAYQAWDLRQQPIDLLSIAAHKFYGPKGVGALIVRPGVPLLPPMTGGSQEEGRRPGTSNVAFAVGMARALALAADRRAADVAHVTPLRDRLIRELHAALGDRVRLTGHETQRLPNHASFAIRDVSGNEMLMHLDMAGVAASSGSACLVGNPEPSKVLQALGLGPSWTLGGLRFTFGRGSEPHHVDRAVAAVETAVTQMRAYAG